MTQQKIQFKKYFKIRQAQFVTKEVVDFHNLKSNNENYNVIESVVNNVEEGSMVGVIHNHV